MHCCVEWLIDKTTFRTIQFCVWVFRHVIWHLLSYNTKFHETCSTNILKITMVLLYNNSLDLFPKTLYYKNLMSVTATLHKHLTFHQTKWKMWCKYKTKTTISSPLLDRLVGFNAGFWYISVIYHWSGIPAVHNQY